MTWDELRLALVNFDNMTLFERLAVIAKFPKSMRDDIARLLRERNTPKTSRLAELIAP